MYLKRGEEEKKNTSIDSIQLLNERKRTKRTNERKLSLVVFLVTLNFLNFCRQYNEKMEFIFVLY